MKKKKQNKLIQADASENWDEAGLFNNVEGQTINNGDQIVFTYFYTMKDGIISNISDVKRQDNNGKEWSNLTWDEVTMIKKDKDSETKDKRMLRKFMIKKRENNNDSNSD